MLLRDDGLATDSLQFDGDETIVVQLADKVEDGTRCYADSMDVCIGGECMVSAEVGARSHALHLKRVLIRKSETPSRAWAQIQATSVVAPCTFFF